MYLRYIAVLAISVCAANAADVHVIEEIVAKVNNDIITKSEIDNTRKMLELELRQQGMNGSQLQTSLQQRQKDALRDQIDQLLLVQKAKDLNITVDPDVTRRMAELQVQSKISDPDKFHEWIRQNTGMSYEDYRQQLKNQLLTQRVIGQEIMSRIVIPEAVKRKYYDDHKKEFVRQEQVFLRQILVSTEGKTPDQVAAADKKAKDLVARARKGDKFADLARDNSDDPETARSGGELPPFKRGELLKQIEDIVFKADKGFVTDPIKVPTGYLILKVEDRWAPGQASYEEVENEITERLASPQMEPKVRTYLTKLREEAFLEIRPGYIDSGAAPGKDTSWKDPAQLKPETVTKEQVEASKRKKFLWVIPRGKAKPDAKPGAAPTPAAGASVPPAGAPAANDTIKK